MIAFYLPFFVLFPLLAYILNTLLPAKKENWISRVAYGTAGIQLLAAIVFIIWWVLAGSPVFTSQSFTLYKTADYIFSWELFFDKITATFLLVGSILVFLVTVYSRVYLHREDGYKRFFNTVLFFFFGYNLTIFSGNFETLFTGWEVLGISSFLLIAFYRFRHLPVQNAIKVFAIYRIGDIGLILAIWLSHHLWHTNISFKELNNLAQVHAYLEKGHMIGLFISFMILLAAAAKSAQLPFSSWLPRAMEGPTPSSAIFYGSLSVHMGVFLLLRTHHFWEEQVIMKVAVVILGLLTAIITTGIARVQSSVKSQIAYSSIAQIGLIFIELALGFENIALVHFAGNAFLRTYQLLVSPSVVSYLIRQQFYQPIMQVSSVEKYLPKRLYHTMYMLSLKEWNLESIILGYFWKPLENLGKRTRILTVNRVIIIFLPIYILGIVVLAYKDWLPSLIVPIMPIVISLIGFLFILRSFTERRSVKLSWLLMLMNHFWVVLAISFNAEVNILELVIYLSGIVVAGIIGFSILVLLQKKERYISLHRFHGHAFEHPRMALIFLFCGLAVSGFPISPTFIGEDLFFTHIHENQFLLAMLVAMSFIVDGLAMIRLYARVFMGSHVKSYHSIAYKSS
ncbi:MAG: hypothetical protein EAZ13_03880 [Sphingobacteriia bacterium]|nr:MAG: hypothetical protein EAZ13_03880 [Sphingobacteriia bacterium]